MQPDLSLSPIYDSIPEGTPRLYHYTSQAGLLGMVQGRHLWLTHIHYMNDSSEYEYAMEFISKVLKEDYGIDPEGEISYETQAIHWGNVFSFSLSEEEDLLSQWRGYSPNGGYSVSFDNKQLSEIMKDNGLYIGKCVYDEQEQRGLIHRYVVGSTPDVYRERFTARPGREPRGNTPQEIEQDRLTLEAQVQHAQSRMYRPQHEHRREIFRNAMRYAPLFKHKSFAEEKEWRIIAMSTDRPELREGKSFMVPYLRIPMVKDKETDYLQGVKIIIGPGAHKELAKRACRLLKTDALISESTIPFRNW